MKGNQTNMVALMGATIGITMLIAVQKSMFAAIAAIVLMRQHALLFATGARDPRSRRISFIKSR